MTFSGNFNKDEIISILQKLAIKQDGFNVLTYFNNRLISNEQVSEVYGVFDFSDFAIKFIDQVENYFTPIKYEIRFNHGVQTLNLIGEKVEIDDDEYVKYFSIVNSTDRSRILSSNVGLKRLTNNSIIVFSEKSDVSAKHCKYSIVEKVKSFLENIKNFDIVLDKNTAILKQMKSKTICLNDIAPDLLLNEKGIVKSSILLKFRALCKKLYNSNRKELLHQYNLFNNPIKFLDHDTKRFEFNAMDIFNQYVELFKEKDSSEIKRETTRILKVLI